MVGAAPLISELPELVVARNWAWTEWRTGPLDSKGFWIATDPQGRRWVAKLRGRDRGLRELAFARLAQNLGWSCQTSMFLSIPETSHVLRKCEGDEIQLVHWFYEQADVSEASLRKMLDSVEEGLNDSSSHPLEAVRKAPIKAFIDWPRSEVAAFLFGANEPCGRLLTTDLTNVIIDSELMFSTNPDLSLDTTWLRADRAARDGQGLELTLEVCASVAGLSTTDLMALAAPPVGVEIKYQKKIERILGAAREGARRTLQLGRPVGN
jgi:hypothetical protein